MTKRHSMSGAVGRVALVQSGRGTQHGMAGERELLVGREDPCVHRGPVVADPDEDGLELTHLCGDRPQLLGRPVQAVAEDDDQTVAAVGGSGEHVDVPVVESIVGHHW